MVCLGFKLTIMETGLYFPYGHVTEEYDASILYYAGDEWRKMFDAWAFFCFDIAGFEIVRTASMGLGKI